MVRRNPGRMDGRTWQGSTFICSRRIDCDYDDMECDAEYDERPSTPDFGVSLGDRDPMVIHSLLDIARPAKQRGVTKGFEIIQRVRDVITLEDDDDDCGSVNDDEGWSEDDLAQWREEDEDDYEWEELYRDEREKPKTYVAALKEK
ncbi:hypothetical protein L208DRAFT_1395398 [Tricholoma matsutake]|nr:hypothetical protein L208DRAFT_1395398 [Tricholoma matsutake 945]